jgi:hypothetical protein
VGSFALGRDSEAAGTTEKFQMEAPTCTRGIGMSALMSKAPQSAGIAGQLRKGLGTKPRQPEFCRGIAGDTQRLQSAGPLNDLEGAPETTRSATSPQSNAQSSQLIHTRACTQNDISKVIAVPSQQRLIFPALTSSRDQHLDQAV